MVRTNDKFILDENGEAVPCADLMTWAEWFEKSLLQRRILLDEIGGVKISTVFLGLNHRWGEGPPILFESMIFGGKYDQDMERYETKEQALAGHARMLERVKNEHS